MPKHLFIGGPVDGKMIGVPEGMTEYLFYEAGPPICVADAGKALPEDFAFVHRYFRQTIQTRACYFDIFCYGTMPDHAIIERLIEGYKRA